MTSIFCRGEKKTIVMTHPIFRGKTVILDAYKNAVNRTQVGLTQMHKIWGRLNIMYKHTYQQNSYVSY